MTDRGFLRSKGIIRPDEGIVERWRGTIGNLRPGGLTDEIQVELESRIDDVEDKVRSKWQRLAEIEEAIREMESRL